MSFTVFTVKNLRTSVIELYLDAARIFLCQKKLPKTGVKLKVTQPKASHLTVSNNSKSAGKEIRMCVIKPFPSLHYR